MREVRMTFGEHLEDLRKRIFTSLLWLGLAVVVSFVYGEDLLEWSMGPHKVAIRGAVRERSIAVLEKKGLELLAIQGGKDPVLSAVPEGAASPEGGAAGGPWDSLFADELARVALRDSLRDFCRTHLVPLFGGQVQPGELEKLADGLAEALARGRGEAFMPVAARGLPARFRLLEEDLRRTARTIGATPVKRFLGVGKSVEDVLGPISEFNRYLAERGEALRQAPGALAAAPYSPLVQRLETIYGEMEARAKSLAQDEAKALVLLSFLDGFMAYFRVALVFGLFFSTPFILYEMWKFVGAGLYPHEQRYVLIFMPFSLALFFGGALFGYFSVIPVSLEFLAGWGTELAELSFTLTNYLGLFFTLTVILGLVFQLPLVMVFLSKVGAVGPAGFRRARKWAFLGSVVFAAVVTPPDPLSWTLVAGPMVLLYELGIMIVSISGRRSLEPSGGVRRPEGGPEGARV